MAHPRFMTDGELQKRFGLSERSLRRCRLLAGFPKRDEIINKTDSRAVEAFFDQRASLDVSTQGRILVPQEREAEF